MSTTKHTPAPWKMFGGHIYTKPPESEDFVLPVYMNAKNRALVESAPDLLAALREVETYLHSALCLAPDTVTEAVHETVRAAIAKATAGQPDAMDLAIDRATAVRS